MDPEYARNRLRQLSMTHYSHGLALDLTKLPQAIYALHCAVGQGNCHDLLDDIFEAAGLPRRTRIDATPEEWMLGCRAFCASLVGPPGPAVRTSTIAGASVERIEQLIEEHGSANIQLLGDGMVRVWSIDRGDG